MTVSGDMGHKAIARPRRAAIRSALAGSAAAIVAVLPAAAWAQATPQIPTREEIQRPAPPPAVQPNEQIVAVDDGIERAPCPLANPEFANVRFTLR
ncbi:MAG: ShlB/FhaC/HecB family hemolysin secretion/activation protein, partial [Sphingopyxis sp.]